MGRGRGIVAETIKNGDKGGRKYDMDEFNAASIKRFRATPEAQFMTWYEAERQRMITLVSGLTVEQLGMRRIQSWLDAVLLEHLKEHGADAPRFLVQDILQREWGDCRGRFAALAPEQQAAFLKKQGFERFRDLLAHILAWWEKGIAVIEASSAEDPSDVEDVDAFNAQAVARFGQLPEQSVLEQFEQTRLMLANLVDMLPDEVLARPNIQNWLRADVLDHYYEHAI